jgi:hypothetical protein
MRRRNSLEPILLIRHQPLGLCGQKSLAIGNRDLVIVRVDFGKRQEPLTVSTILYERGLQRWLHARDFGEIDVSF